MFRLLSALLLGLALATPAAAQTPAVYGSAAYYNLALSNTPVSVKPAPGLLTGFSCYNPVSPAAVEYLLLFDVSPVRMALTGTTNGTTSTSSNVLHFAATPANVVKGQGIIDTTTGASIAAGTTVVSTTATTVTMSANAAGAGVGGTDGITFFSVPRAVVPLTPSTVTNSNWPIGIGFPLSSINAAVTSTGTPYGAAAGSALACNFTYN
jgi:hypothetical protein